jgi:hypothetical protein
MHHETRCATKITKLLAEQETSRCGPLVPRLDGERCHEATVYALVPHAFEVN